MASFQDILNTPAADAKPPEALPTGTYLSIVDGQPEIVQLGEKQNYAAIFSLKPLQAQKDVDETRLSEVLNGSHLSDKRFRHTLWLTEDAKFRLAQFYDHLGLERGSKTLGELIPETMGKQVLVNVGHRAGKDGQAVYAEVKSTAKV